MKDEKADTELIAALGLLDEGGGRLVPFFLHWRSEVDEIRAVRDGAATSVESFAVAELLVLVVQVLRVIAEEAYRFCFERLESPLSLILCARCKRYAVSSR